MCVCKCVCKCVCVRVCVFVSVCVCLQCDSCSVDMYNCYVRDSF